MGEMISIEQVLYWLEQCIILFIQSGSLEAFGEQLMQKITDQLTDELSRIIVGVIIEIILAILAWLVSVLVPIVTSILTALSPYIVSILGMIAAAIGVSLGIAVEGIVVLIEIIVLVIILIIVAIVLIIIGIINFIYKTIQAIVLLTLYVLNGIGLSRIAKKLGVKHCFLAWIPFVNVYLLGACAEQSMKRHGKKAWKWGWILLIATLLIGIGIPVLEWIVLFLLLAIPEVALLICLLLELFTLILLPPVGYCLWCVCKEFVGKVPAIFLALLGTLSGNGIAILLLIVSFFKLRNVESDDAETLFLNAAPTTAGDAPVAVPYEDVFNS